MIRSEVINTECSLYPFIFKCCKRLFVTNFCGFRHRMGPDGTLVIRNMEEKDGGVYRCLASSLAGTDTTNSILTYIGEFHVHTRGGGGPV